LLLSPAEPIGALLLERAQAQAKPFDRISLLCQVVRAVPVVEEELTGEELQARAQGIGLFAVPPAVEAGQELALLHVDGVLLGAESSKLLLEQLEGVFQAAECQCCQLDGALEELRVLAELCDTGLERALLAFGVLKLLPELLD
jgi:hypothetical protein